MAEFLSGEGIRLAYDTAGAGDPPIIFVHGWSCDRSYFAPQFGHFAAGHAVAAMDLRGHGDSSRPDPGPGCYDIDVLAGDVLALAGAAGFSRPVLVGHSLGAPIGLACAARPGAIRALLMVEPAPITNTKAKAFFRDSLPPSARMTTGRGAPPSSKGCSCPPMRPAGKTSSSKCVEPPGDRRRAHACHGRVRRRWRSPQGQCPGAFDRFGCSCQQVG